MPSKISRRKFLSQTSLTVAGLSLFSCASTRKAGIGGVPGLKLGYSAITWGGNDVQAIKDIASLGFKGIQLRSTMLKEFGTKPQEVRAMLDENKLALPMFSSGNANINTGDDETIINTHISNAKFVKALGGENIQITNSSRPKTGAPTTDDLKKYGQLLNEIGKRTRDVGIQVNYHNHMHQLGETPEEVQIILDNTDNANVRFLLDIAHYQQGGGDPVKAVTQYKDRLSALHLKDVRPNPAGTASAYQFVELGQGRVDLPGVFKALNNIGFTGWGIVELDSVPDKAKTPVQCANITKTYLKTHGFNI
jgi:inosose dehydratase